MAFKIDTEVVAALQKLAATNPNPILPALGDVKSHRDGLGRRLKPIYENGYPKNDPLVTQKDFQTTSDDGHEVLLRWYSKAHSKASPAILFVHSGGLIIGEVADFDNILHHYVSETGIPFLSVEYRLSPDVRYPKALEDTYAGLKWLHANASSLGVDDTRIGVMGESAGGALAAAVCIYARDLGGPSISKQLLIYPMLDDRSINAEKALEPYLTWRGVDNQTGWEAYLGSDERGADDVPPTASPARLVDAAGLPPLYIEVGELDLFRDENIDYAARFWKAGISAELHVLPGLPHGYDFMAAKATGSQDALKICLKAMRSIFEQL